MTGLAWAEGPGKEVVISGAVDPPGVSTKVTERDPVLAKVNHKALVNIYTPVAVGVNK